MIQQAPQILPREQPTGSTGSAFFFAVAVVVDPKDAPRVSVKAAPGSTGSVEVTAVEETLREHDQRVVVFQAEAERSQSAWWVAVVVECGATLLTLDQVSVPALGGSGPA